MNKNLQQKELYEQTSQMFKEYYANVMLPSLVCWKKGCALEKRENSLMIYYFF